MIADLDGANLRAVPRAAGRPRRPSAVSADERAEVEIQTGRSGIITSFSSGGPTNFDHKLKPDVAAPGGQILSSTLPEFAGAPFAVFDGTSMAAPHVAGAAALLLQQHPGWTPEQVKSALTTSAAPAWGDTARTHEASVLLEGGGLDRRRGAPTTPKLFAEPSSLSFGDLDVTTAARRAQAALSLDHSTTRAAAAGTWTVDAPAAVRHRGRRVDRAPATSLGDDPARRRRRPARSSRLRARRQAAATGDNYGFVVLRRGAVDRRIPYYFAVTRPAARARARA